MSKAIFSPGPSYTNSETRKYAGWVVILDMYKEALGELGYEVIIPKVDSNLIDQASTVSKILSYDLVAAKQLRVTGGWLSEDIFLGPPGYSLIQMSTLFPYGVRKFLYTWNNADGWRDQQLEEEYKHFNAHYDMSPTWRWINKEALKFSDHVIACSPWVKKTHAVVVPEDKISINFWGVDSERYKPPVVTPNGFNILFVGGDPIRKGLIYLLNAFRGLTDCELWVVGCQPFAEIPTNLKIRQFGMVPNEEIASIMSKCHVICIPTLEDGIALAIQEGMSCGLVPITTPECAEVFVDGVSGITVGYRDVDGIKEALKRLQSEPVTMAKFSQEARKQAVSQPWVNTKESFKEIIRKQMIT